MTTHATRAALILSCAFAIAATAPVPFSGTDLAAHAQGRSEDRGNRGGNGNGNGRSERADRDRGDDRPGRGNGNGGAERFIVTESGEVERELHPRDLGRWNASNANQAALDAHVRNGNFNGTVGALAQYQLVSRYAAGEDLSAIEQQRVDELLSGGSRRARQVDIDDDLRRTNELSRAAGLDATYRLEGTTVTCTGTGCDDVAIELLQAEVNGQLPDDPAMNADELLHLSEQRIVDGGPRETPGEALLDTVANALGVVRDAFAGEGTTTQ
ncbi:hypothetical protein [Pontivivens ytuae]|uniref:Uncharacterized protein n=1 Tax=Pontivivens ytuae TaxID=2789856 RepID=A0A7S9QEJ5_9RHOB|nr:hypothetical protein [Pontivivens ytuae]QPH55477.1 hypothetical protein I0K15_07005 [Pontivivens ytuae]